MNPAPADNEGILTRYVRALAAGTPPSRELVEDVIAELLQMVRSGLWRTRRWYVPPREMEYPDEGKTWSEVFAREMVPTIVLDYHDHLFGYREDGGERGRRVYLQDAVARGWVIEPMCGGLLVDQFLCDRHADGDECGHAVYQNTLGSIRSMVDAGTLQAECERIGSDTLVRFEGSSADPAAAHQIEAVVRGHRDSWDSTLKTLWRVANLAQKQLAVQLGTLPNAEITSLRAGETADGLKPAVREYAPKTHAVNLAAFSDDGDGGSATDYLFGVQPDADPNEARDHLLQRLEQLRDAIPAHRTCSTPDGQTVSVNPRTRQGMTRLVHELIQIADAGGTFVLTDVAKMFNVAKQTMSEHWKHLKCLARTLWPEECAAPGPSHG